MRHWLILNPLGNVNVHTWGPIALWSNKLVQNNLNVSAPINRITNYKRRLNSLWGYKVSGSNLLNLLSCPFLIRCEWVNVFKAGRIVINWKNISETREKNPKENQEQKSQIRSDILFKFVKKFNMPKSN